MGLRHLWLREGCRRPGDTVSLAGPVGENRRLSIEQIAQLGKIQSAGNICPGGSNEGSDTDFRPPSGRRRRGDHRCVRE